MMGFRFISSWSSTFLKKIKKLVLFLGGENTPLESISLLSFKFPPETETAFLKNYYTITLTRTRLAIGLGATLYGMFYLLDYFLLPDVREIFFRIRFVYVLPIGILIYILSFWEIFRHFYQVLSTLYTIVAGIGIVSMTLIQPHYTEAYYTGIILVLIYTHILSGLRFYWASFSGWTTVIAYIVGINWVTTSTYPEYLDNIFFIAGSNILLMFGGYFIELFYRREFQLQYLLNQKRERIEEINVSLEARVAERTNVLKEEIAERENAQRGAESVLEQKDILLREVYHRTKNNMNVIISLLNMQAAEQKKRPAKDVFNQISERIFSMSLVHEQLYQSEDLSTIRFEQYIRKLVSRVKESNLKAWENIQVNYSCEPIEIGLEEAVPLGLAVNEIITNTFKHGYDDGATGNIQVNLKLSEIQYLSLEVSSDGHLFPEGFNLEDPETLGLRLIKILIEDQLQSNLSISSDEQVSYKIELLPIEE